MLYDIILFTRLSTMRVVNGFLYFLLCLPIIKKVLPQDIYCEIGFKKKLSIVVSILHTAYLMAKSGLYIGICIAMPITFAHAASPLINQSDYLLLGFVILTGILGALFNTKFLQANTDTHILIRQARMGAKRYILHNAAYLYMVTSLSMLCSFAIITLIFAFPLWYAFAAVCIYLGSHLGCDALQLCFFKRKKRLWKSYKIAYNAICIPLVCLFLAALLVPFFFQFQLHFMNSIFLGYALFCIPFGIWGYLYIQRFHAYNDLVNALIDSYAEVLTLTTNKKIAASYAVNLKESDYSRDELLQRSKLHGYTMLNALFFQRHKRLIARPIKRRLLIILCISAATILLNFFLPLHPEQRVLTLIPTTVFLMYLLNISEPVTRAMFMNCDVSLLHYGYYRKPATILKNFKIRLRSLIRYNLVISLTLIICSNLCFILLSIPFVSMDLLLFDLTILLLTIFFSTHYLFAYYIFQPYNEQFEMKNPFFSLINGFIYFICYLCIQLTGNVLFVSGVLVATIVYIVIAMLIVYHFAHKTFHLK